jgi:N-methylhydantoinase A
VVEKPVLVPEPLIEGNGIEAMLGQKTIACGDGKHRFSLYDRERLRPGAMFAGPALVFQMDSTVFVPPEWSARVDGYRNIVLECV